MKRLELFAGLAVLAAGVAGCAGTNDTTVGNPSYGGNNVMGDAQQQQAVTTATQALQDKTAQQVTTGINKFGLNLFSAVMRARPNQNVCISPVSVGDIMGLLYNGASGETQKQFGNVLGVGKLTTDQIDTANKNLQALLTNIDPNKVDLKVANSIWVDSSEPVSSDYLQKAQANFAAKVTTLDFKAPDAPSTINDWVKDSTHGKIASIIQKVPSDAKLYAINAVYFNGTWQRPFDKNKTQPQTFHVSDTNTEQTPMMNQTGSFGYLSNSDVTGVALPYGSGRLEMDVILPAGKLDIPGLLKKLTAETWTNWAKSMKTTQLQVQIPTFQSQFTEVLNDPLKSLGVNNAFDSEKADFTAMLSKSGATPTGKLYLSEVKHKTYINVNELGTEAAAATSGQITATAIVATPTKFIADHPFLYLIRDTTTGTIIFEGVVLDPQIQDSDPEGSKKDDKIASSPSSSPTSTQAATPVSAPGSNPVPSQTSPTTSSPGTSSGK